MFFFLELEMHLQNANVCPFFCIAMVCFPCDLLMFWCQASKKKRRVVEFSWWEPKGHPHNATPQEEVRPLLRDYWGIMVVHDFISFTEIWWTWNVGIIFCACLVVLWCCFHHACHVCWSLVTNKRVTKWIYIWLYFPNIMSLAARPTVV